MINLIWLVPLLPLVGFLINGLGRNTLSKGVIGFVGSTVIFASFAISVGLFTTLQSAAETSYTISLFDWIQVGSLQIPLAFTLDHLSAIMLLIVTGVGFLIHLYSTGYMRHDEGFGKFFAYLNLFVFFMLLLVLGSNYIVMFIGWEGVGLCSYLLIGFWYKNIDYASAAKKAFVMNRIGDLGFLIAVFLIFTVFGSLDFGTVMGQAKSMTSTSIMTLITLLLFLGATGKSAQLPLFTWLPDAMAGPTPVSALIHAATMVTAGIYMIARSSALFDLAPLTQDVILYVGLATAIIAAIIALTQTDIKKVLAYSTVSQLGYMFIGLGVGAYSASFFHVITHAFFKALLFLGAGAVIDALHHEQDMRKMGGLKSKLPVTFLTMLIGTIAISGIPPFSGFFSKDEILAHLYTHSPVLWGVAVIGAMLTAFYMFRMLFLTFFGTFRGHEDAHHPIHEVGTSMKLPLIVLAILSAIGGFIGVPEVLGGKNWLSHWLAPLVGETEMDLSHSTEWLLMGLSVAAAVISILVAYRKYVGKKTVPVADHEHRSFSEKLSYDKFYIDEFYDALVRKPLDFCSKFFYKVIDKSLIDGVVNGLGRFAGELSGGLRKLQSGNVGFYIFMMVIGIIGLLIYTVINF